MMERLTRGKEMMTLWRGDYGFGTCDVQELINKLGEYEDAEEQGSLLRLPCKIGDTVYIISGNSIEDYKVGSVDGVGFRVVTDNKYNPQVSGFMSQGLGQDIFLAQSEAEQALEKMKEDNDCQTKEI